MSDDQPMANTDKELWRETPGDYYAPSLFVTEGGGIGINVGGAVYVMPIREWHQLACGEHEKILASGREERRRVWEEAAQHCRTDACGIDIHDPFAKRLADYFQYRADHEQFGPAWERNRQQAREEAT